MTMSSVCQDGSSGNDYTSTAILSGGGSTVLAGYTEGSWGSTNTGLEDFAAVKLDTDGTTEWKWQVNGNLDSRGRLLGS